jgi:exonuclease SbcD
LKSFRFLHAADIHLDSPLKGLSGQLGSVAERIRSATREAFMKLVTFAIDERIDFVVIAGDLYDGDWRDYKTGLYFASQMGRLNQAGIPVYLLHGNHDAESQITKRIELPDNVHVFGTKKAETFRAEGLSVVLHGQSYKQRDVVDNLAADYPAPEPETFNIGVLHTGLGGMGGHANYAPCSLNDLTNKGYEYWALGHVHQAEVLHVRPHIVFPGNLQGRHVRETGTKGAYLVTVTDGEVTELVPVPCDVVRWIVLSVGLDNVNSVGDANDRIRQALERAVAEEADGRLLACRIVLQGRCEVHEMLVATANQLLADARSHALGMGGDIAWVEKVVIATDAIVDQLALAQREDAIGELQRMMLEASNDEQLLAQIEVGIGKFIRQLPHEVRADIEDQIFTSASDGDYAALVADVLPYLSARLSAVEE